jgi:hypothetical protein
LICRLLTPNISTASSCWLSCLPSID